MPYWHTSGLGLPGEPAGDVDGVADGDDEALSAMSRDDEGALTGLTEREGRGGEERDE